MKHLSLYLSISIVSMLMGFAYRFHLPQIKTWALSSLKVYSYDRLPVLIEAKDIEFSIIPFRASLVDLKVRSNKNQVPELRKLIAKKVHIYPDLLALSLGSAKISEVVIDNIRLVVIAEPIQANSAKQNSGTLDIDSLLPTVKKYKNLISKIPIEKLSINNLNYFARYSHLKLSNLITNAELNLTKIESNLFLDFNFPTVKLKETNNDDSFLDFSISSKLAVTPERIQLESLKVFQDDSYLDLQAIARDWLNKDQRKFQFDLKSKLDAKKIRRLALRFQPSLPIPKLLGQIEADLELDSEDIKRLRGKISLSNFSIDGYKIGNFQTRIDASPDKLSLIDASIINKLNKIKFSSLNLLKEQDGWDINLKPQILSLELRQLLKDIKVGDTPLRLDIKSEPLDCMGKLSPQFSLSCNGNIELPYFRVYNSASDQTIHSFKNASVSGKVLINEKGVYPEGSIKLGMSSGKASGFIEYENGFNIDFESKNFDFQYIESLADLPISGLVNLKGNTKGSSKFATIDMNIKAKRFEFFQYRFGNLDTKFKYRSGVLSFDRIRSRIDRSKFSGKLKVDLNQNNISGRFRAPNSQLEDIQYLIANNLQFPVSVSGIGNLFLSFDGPLKFNELNYDLIYNSESIKIAKENFEKLDVNLSARGGNLRSNKLMATKAGRPIAGSLKLDPDLNMLLKLNSEPIPIEAIRATENIGGQISGFIDADASIQGPIDKLNYSVNARARQLKLGGVDLGKSNLKYDFTTDTHKLDASLFENSLNVKTSIPNQNSEQAFDLKLVAKDFNFTALFALAGLNPEQVGFQSAVSANVDLKSKKGGVWASSGFAEIDKLELSRGPLSLSAEKPLRIEAKAGVFTSEEWKLTGSGTDITYHLRPTKGGELNSRVEGNINLALASFAVPFVDGLRGELSLSTDITGKLIAPKFSGSALLKDAEFRIPGFPHPFERLSSDIIFNNNSIVLNKIQSDLAGGKLLASGNLQFLGFTNLPMNISGSLTSSKLEFIDGIELVSSGDFELSGSWFPFLLKADAIVSAGKIAPDTSSSSAQKVRPSRYLPKVLLRDSTDPIQLDVSASISNKVRIEIPEVRSNIQGNMRVTGPVGNMTYNGDISFVPGGTLFFRDTPFSIQTGTIGFNQVSELNPNLFIDAQTNITEQSSQITYDVNLQLQGTLRNFTTNLDSQPSLPRSDLISLLALGLTSAQLDQQSVENQRDLQMMELGAAVISNSPLGKEIEDRTGFTFKLSTDIDETDSTELKVVISKQVTPKIGASASVLGNNSKKDVKVEYKLNTDLSLIGSWESTTFEEDGSSAVDQNQQSDIFGLDLRYKVEFK